MQQENGSFKKIIVVELTVLAFGVLCLLPTAIFFTRLNRAQAPVMTPTPEARSIESLQTQAAQLSSTMNAPSNSSQAIPITGAKATETPESGSVLVTFINVGQGESILIQSPEGKYGLIDGGSAGGAALEYLQRHGVTSLDVMVASAPQPEHIGGLTEILRGIPVERVVTNGQTGSGPEYENFLDAIAESGAEYQEAKRGDAITLGSLRMDVLHPGTIVGADLNVNSLVLRLGYDNVVFLFMGDSNNISDQEILGSVYPLGATILKIGHHASQNSISASFLEAVHPEVAIYTPGRDDGSDQPSTETIEALQSAGSKVYSTDSSGTIVVLADATGYVLAREFENDLAPIPENTSTIPVPTELSVVVSEYSGSARIGEDASIAIETAPGAVCSNVMKFASGLGGVANLGTKAADAAGMVRWSWRVGTNATAGNFLIEIYCTLNGSTSGGVIPFVVAP